MHHCCGCLARSCQRPTAVGVYKALLTDVEQEEAQAHLVESVKLKQLKPVQAKARWLYTVKRGQNLFRLYPSCLPLYDPWQSLRRHDRGTLLRGYAKAKEVSGNAMPLSNCLDITGVYLLEGQLLLTSLKLSSRW
jgi:hypothetical protein